MKNTEVIGGRKRNGEDNEVIIALTLVDSCGGYLKEERSPFGLNEAYLDSHFEASSRITQS